MMGRSHQDSYTGPAATAAAAAVGLTAKERSRCYPDNKCASATPVAKHVVGPRVVGITAGASGAASVLPSESLVLEPSRRESTR